MSRYGTRSKITNLENNRSKTNGISKSVCIPHCVPYSNIANESDPFSSCQTPYMPRRMSVNQLTDLYQLAYLVADSALYTAETLPTHNELCWFTRVPEN